MSLKPLKIVTNEAPKKSKSEIPTVEIDGNPVSIYNAAVVALKNAEAEVALNGKLLKDFGLPKLFDLAVANPDTPPSSIKLRDEKGETVRFTSQNRYGIFDPEVADETFKLLKADIADYAQFVAKASFDNTIFLAQAGTTAGDEGKFSTKIFNQYKQAIDRVTAQLIRDGLLPVETKSPLLTSQVANVKPDFHEKRWKAFPNTADQIRLTKAIPNILMLVPVVDADGGK